jgi:hypothetical protein
VISFGEVCSQTGFLEVQGTLPLVDVPLLDLVCCLRSDRYFQPEVCGTAASRAPVMSFFGQRNDESAKIFVTPPSKVTVLVDGTPRGEGNPSTAFSFVDASLGTGQHHVRAEQEDGGVWEATFTLPDRIWFRATRRDGDAMEVYFQEPPGATTYRLSSGSLTVDGTASPLRFPITRELSLIARFGKLPFSATATATLPP